MRNADVFQLKAKQLEKLRDYLADKNKDSFESLDEILEVLYDDANKEVQLDQAEDVVDSIKSSVQEYKKDIDELEKKYKEKQSKTETAMDEKPFSLLLSAFEKERRNLDEFVKEVEAGADSIHDPLILVMKKVLGNKTLDTFTQTFVKGAK